jgi:hypothetical protein
MAITPVGLPDPAQMAQLAADDHRAGGHKIVSG